MKAKPNMRTYLMLFILFLINQQLIAQTKTENETLAISTGHPSITMEARKAGVYLEVRVFNNHNITYNISFTAEVTLRGKSGEIKKTLETSGKVAANKSYFASTNIYWADVKENLYFSLVDAKRVHFDAQPIQQQTQRSNNVSNSQNSTSLTPSSPKPSPNASVQELAAWQRSQASTTQSQTKTSNPTYVNTQASNVSNGPSKGISKADLQQLLENNRQESNRILGISPSVANQSTEQAASAGLWSLADSWVKARQERLEREEREEEKKQIRAENERIAKENRLRMINNRSLLINKFEPKDIPLSSREKANKIYYFIYAFEQTNLNQEYGAIVYLSNVFEIGTYKDGTRAYTSTVKNEIVNLSPFSELMHGYYYTAEEAENARKTFASLLQSNGVTIQLISYKGKAGAANANGTANTTTNSLGKKIGVGDNFAPATFTKSKPTENTSNLREEQPKKTDLGVPIQIGKDKPEAKKTKTPAKKEGNLGVPIKID
ncbi:hypothetical protein [Pedobacter helvus]|uniref:Uncharacterized protein n=1 Tax=Pedobacter helvus TaxID=2563444 RepID=A0ABW9JGR4_9SPHI|nr:hypothetical protein [Pedobacter ureilyticus]